MLNTYKASLNDPNHSPFLKAFGEFHVAKLPQTEAPAERLQLELLNDIQRDLQVIKQQLRETKSESAIEGLFTTTELNNILVPAILDYCSQFHVEPSDVIQDTQHRTAFISGIRKVHPTLGKFIRTLDLIEAHARALKIYRHS